MIDLDDGSYGLYNHNCLSICCMGQNSLLWLKIPANYADTKMGVRVLWKFRVCVRSLCDSLLSRSEDSGSPDAGATKSPDGNAGITPKDVLIIDDDVSVREAIGYMLEELGMKFDAVASGEEGLAKLEEQTYGVILLDLDLHTRTNGVEIFEILRECPGCPHVVFITASSSREFVFERAVKLDQTILRKPFSLDELQKVIDRVR